MPKKDFSLYAVVRIRGSVDQSKDVRHTLELLNLTRPNHAIIVPKDTTHEGMLQKVKDAITWGEISKQTLKELITKRGRLVGDKPVTTKALKDYNINSITDLVNDLFDGKKDMRHIEGLKPIFRLHPPRKGFKSVKNPYTRKGDLGYRGEEINALIERMI
jgi:large subunit ribosomal protein L30